jgi:hypothetical protein
MRCEHKGKKLAFCVFFEKKESKKEKEEREREKRRKAESKKRAWQRI